MDHKVRIEIPVFKKCCLCIPLRPGLLVWGYINLIVAVLALIFLGMYFDARMSQNSTKSVASMSTLLAINMADVVIDIVFVIGAHMKNPKLLKVFYYYSIVGLSLAAAIYLLHLGWFIYSCITYSMRAFMIYTVFVVLGVAAALLLSMLIEFYLILLVRSQIFKLETNVQFKFVNKASEGGTLDTDEDKLEKIKYDRLNSLSNADED